jgi:hypothetical protein
MVFANPTLTNGGITNYTGPLVNIDIVLKNGSTVEIMDQEGMEFTI